MKLLQEIEILEKEFKIDTRGYRLKEVDQYLDIIIVRTNATNVIPFSFFIMFLLAECILLSVGPKITGSKNLYHHVRGDTISSLFRL